MARGNVGIIQRNVVSVAVIPIQVDVVGLGIIAFLLAMVAFGAAALYFAHRQTVLRIETGAHDGERADRRWILAVGLVLLAVGVANSVEAAVVGDLAGLELTVAAVGAAALAYYFVVDREDRAAEESNDHVGDENTAR